MEELDAQTAPSGEEVGAARENGRALPDRDFDE
jgi:hypothetical protein